MASNVAELQDAVNTKTSKLVLLTIVTGGVYMILWTYRHCATIERITKSKIAGEKFLIWMAVLFGLNCLLHEIGMADNEMQLSTGDAVAIGIGRLLMYGYAILYFVWAAEARKALQKYALTHKIPLKVNVFFTILFTIFYINYCINKLPEIQWKQQISNS